MTTTIHLKQIHVETLIGARAHEREQKQPLVIDLSFEVDAAKAIEKDHLSATIDYSSVVQEVLGFAAKSGFVLLESFSHALAQFLMNKFFLKKIHLLIFKPQATNGRAQVFIETTHNS